MFVKNVVNKTISIESGYKTRLIHFSNSRKYAEFAQKLTKHETLFHEQIYEGKGIPGLSLNVGNKKIKGKQIEYPLKGGCFKFYDGGPRYILEELSFSRTDSFHIPEYNELNERILKFVNNKKFYEESELFYKMGILLYGFPGNGKTSWIRYLLNNDVLPEKATVIWFKDLPPQHYIDEFKKVKGLKLFIFEEITSMTTHADTTRELLQFLDGEQTIDNTIYIATTNYPQQLPINVVERPGRFDLIFEMDNPKEETRKVILKQYFKDTFEEKMVGNSEGLSHAEIKECFLLSRLYSLTFEGAVKKMKDHKQFVKNGFEKYKKIGFSNE